MIPIKIYFSNEATAAIRTKQGKLDPAVMCVRMAVRLARHWRDHLAKMPRKHTDHPSSGFWEDAARRVTGIAMGTVAGGGSGVLLRSDKLGLRKRYYGGPVVAVNHANITIPICPEARGTTVADWGRDNLVLVILADGRKFYALWLGGATAQKQFKSLFRKLGKRTEGSTRRANQFREGAQSDDLIDRVQQAREPKKPNVIIFKSKGSSTVARTERHGNLKFLFRLMKETAPQEPNPGIIPGDLSKVALDAAMEATR